MPEAPVTVVSPWSRPARRLALFVLAAVAALYCGFVQFPVASALNLLRFGGYYFILLTFVLWIVLIWRANRRPTPEPRPPVGRETLVAALVIAGLTVLALAHETFRSKILYDEYVLQATAYDLHFFRDNSAIVRGYDLQGVFLPLDSYVDKRPIFFPFLLCLIHDLSGYRLANVYVLNAILFVVTLGLSYLLGRRLNGWRGGLLAVALLGTLPLFAQNASGAGMELLNVCMLVAVMLQAAAWLREPDEKHLSVFVVSVVLLVQSRYESALYAAPTAVAVLWGWWRARRLVLSWPAVCAPLLLIPVAWQQKVVSNTPVMWELRENQTSRFSLSYLADNLQGAWNFFAADGLAQANSRPIFFAGAVALLAVLVKLILQRRRLLALEPTRASLLLFGGGMLAITALMMFYYWASFSDPMAARFALPLNLLLIFAIVLGASWADRLLPASLLALGAVAIFALGVSSPKQSYHFYSHLGNDEVEWERRIVSSRPPGTRLIIANKSTLPWMVQRTPAILLGRARVVADRLADEMKLPDFSEILVTQSSRPTTALGQYQLVPEDVLPEWFHLELLAERRFGTKLARISRVVAVDLPADFKSTSAPPVAGEAASLERPGK